MEHELEYCDEEMNWKVKT